MKIEDEQHTDQAPPLQVADSQEEEQTMCYVTCREGCIVDVLMGEDSVPQEVWKRSTVLKRFVQDCIDADISNGTDGEGPISIGHDDVMAWVEFTAETGQDHEELCVILEARYQSLLHCNPCLRMCLYYKTISVHL